MRITCSSFLISLILLVAPIVIGAVCPPAFAAGNGPCPPALCRGAQALQFGIAYDFRLSPFQGVTLAYEKFLRDRVALRLGVGISTDYQVDDRVTELEDVITGQVSTDLKDWSYQYTLVCQLASYRGEPFGFCYGVGPEVTYSSYQRQDANYNIYNQAVQGSRYTDWYRTWGAGVNGFLGVQWLATERVRFHAEYFTSLMYKHTDRTYVRVSTGTDNSTLTITDDTDIYGVYPGSTRLGLSVMF